VTLFTYEGVAGEMLREAFEDELFGTDVVLGHEIDDPFVLDGFGSMVACPDEFARFECDGFELFDRFHGEIIV
jgi:hypothetical protein